MIWMPKHRMDQVSISSGDHMKCTLNRKGDVYTVYVPKKDMEQEVTAIDGSLYTLANDWVIDVGELEDDVSLPKTINAKLVSRGD